MNLVTIVWPDTKEQETGTMVEENESMILFKSDLDGTINWVPKEYFQEGDNE